MSTSEVSVCIHGWGVRCRRILLGLAGEVIARRDYIRHPREIVSESTLASCRFRAARRLTDCGWSLKRHKWSQPYKF